MLCCLLPQEIFVKIIACSYVNLSGNLIGALCKKLNTFSQEKTCP